MSLEKKTEELYALKLQAINDYIQKIRTQTAKLFDACQTNSDDDIRNAFQEVVGITDQYEQLFYDIGRLQTDFKNLEVKNDE